MSVHDVLLAQRREREVVRTAEYVERSSVIEAEAGGRIRVVVGPRRAGKSSYAIVIFTVPRFSYKAREQAASNKKAYAVDTGFVDAFGTALSPNWGRLFENLVAIELFRWQLRGEIRFFFWKDAHGIEADFVVQDGLVIRQILQVSMDTSDPKTRQREIRGLCKASRELGCRDLLLLTESEEGLTDEPWEGSVYPVRSIPIWKWLANARMPAIFKQTRGDEIST